MNFHFKNTVCVLVLIYAHVGFANSSADPDLLRQVQSERSAQVYQSNVDTKRCTDPIPSTPYVMALGTGGTHMDLTCPEAYPVMHNWQLELGFAGNSGGGKSRVSCCAVKHEWNTTPL